MPHNACDSKLLATYIRESKMFSAKIKHNLREVYNSSCKDPDGFTHADAMHCYPQRKREQLMDMIMEMLYVRRRLKLFAHEILTFCDIDIMDHMQNTSSFVGFSSGLAATIAPLAEYSAMLFEDILKVCAEFELFEKPLSLHDSMPSLDYAFSHIEIDSGMLSDLHAHLNQHLCQAHIPAQSDDDDDAAEVSKYLDQIHDSPCDSPIDWTTLESPVEEEEGSDDTNSEIIPHITRIQRKRDFSTTSDDDTASQNSEPVRKAKKRIRGDLKSDSESMASMRSASPQTPEFTMETSMEFPVESCEDEVDLILDRIIESDDEGSYSESTEDDSERPPRRKRSRKKNSEKKIVDPEDAWRLDPLLRGALSAPGPSKPRSISENESTSIDSYSISSYSESISSESEEEVDDGRKLSESQNSLRLSVKSDTSPGGSKRGRRNVREIISHRDLNEITKEATAEEHLRRERLRMKISSQDLMADDDELVLDATDPENRIVVHRNLAKVLKTHQRKGVAFMWDNCYESVSRVAQFESGGGCILAHCMGLGKTLQVITLVHTLFKHNVGGLRKVLVIVPLTTISNWEKEIEKVFAYVGDAKLNFDVHTLQSSERMDYRIAIVRSWHTFGGVLLMGYEAFGKMVRKDEPEVLQMLVDPGPDLLVCDEGHKLKNGKSNRTIMINRVVTKRRIILTGTPMQNNLDEYFHMINIVKPNILGTQKEFRNRFVNPITNGQYEDSSERDITVMKKRSHVLHNMTEGFIQRYEERELHQYLPGRFDFVLKVDLAEVQARLYMNYFHNEAYKRRSLFDNANILHMICGHPYTLVLQTELFGKTLRKKMVKENEELSNEVTEMLINDRRWWQDAMPSDYATNIALSAKFQILLSIIDLCLRHNERVLVFSSLIIELDVIEHFLKRENGYWNHGVTYLRMDGRVSVKKRDLYCKRFNNRGNKLTLFLLTQGVGGLGLNLAAANRVVLMDVSWNPTKDNQSIFRAYRLGQEQVCYVYRLVARGTIEEVIYERSVTKQAIAGRVVDKMQISRLFTESSMASMYRCEVDDKSPRPVPIVPSDRVLAELLKRHQCIHTYHNHDDLLKNRPEEDLNEEERKMAWEEYEAEKNYQAISPQNLVDAPMVMSPPNLQVSNPTTYLVPRPFHELAAIPACTNKIVMLELESGMFERVRLSAQGLVFKEGSGVRNFMAGQLSRAAEILIAPSDATTHFYRINRMGEVSMHNYNVYQCHYAALERERGHTQPTSPTRLLEMPTEQFKLINPIVKTTIPEWVLNIRNADERVKSVVVDKRVIDLGQNGHLKVSNEVPIVIDD